MDTRRMEDVRGGTRVEDVRGSVVAARIRVKKVRMVAVWSLDMIVDKCAICRNHIMDICIECQTEEKILECKVAWGACNHAFHAHCIAQWLKSKNVCPLDAKPWSFQNPTN